MSKEYLELIRQNIEDVFTERDETKDQLLIFYDFSDDTKKEIMDYVLSKTGEMYLESMIISQSLLIHFLLYKTGSPEVLDIANNKSYFAVKYLLLPIYTCFISEKIFDLRYPYQFTLKNILTKTDILRSIEERINVYVQKDFVMNLVENIDEFFFTPVANVLKELVFDLKEFSGAEEFLGHNTTSIFDKDDKIGFTHYLRRFIKSEKFRDIFEPDFEIPEEKIERVYKNIQEVFESLNIQNNNREKQIRKLVEKKFFEVTDIKNDFFRKHIFNTL
jgi:hypothetical protein